MVQYTITISADQDTLIKWIVLGYNKEHDTTLTSAEYVQARVSDLLAPFAERYKAFVSGSLPTAFASADAATQAQIKTLLRIP